MVLGARHRRENKELQNVDRQFALDEGDVAADRSRRVGREAQDVAGDGDHPRLLPGQQHAAVFGDLVLLLVGRGEVVRVDAFEAEKDVAAARRHRLADEARHPVDHHIGLDDKGDGQPFFFAEFDQAVEDRLPVSVTREIVVGDEVFRHPPGGVGPDQRLDTPGPAEARLVALDVDDAAKAAIERAAAPGIETGEAAGGAAQHAERQEGRRLAAQIRQIRQVIVDRLEPPALGIDEQGVEPALGLAAEQDDAALDRHPQLQRQLVEHGHDAADVEAADGDLDAGLDKRLGQVHRPQELVALHADHADQRLAAALFDAADDFRGPHDGVGLVVGVDDDLGAAENIAPCRIHRQAVEASQRVRRGEPALVPLDDEAVIVVVRWFDQLDEELAAASAHARHPWISSRARSSLPVPLGFVPGLIAHRGNAR